MLEKLRSNMTTKDINILDETIKQGLQENNKWYSYALDNQI